MCCSLTSQQAIGMRKLVPAGMFQCVWNLFTPPYTIPPPPSYKCNLYTTPDGYAALYFVVYGMLAITWQPQPSSWLRIVCPPSKRTRLVPPHVHSFPSGTIPV